MGGGGNCNFHESHFSNSRACRRRGAINLIEIMRVDFRKRPWRWQSGPLKTPVHVMLERGRKSRMHEEKYSLDPTVSFVSARDDM
jgi:hypothetical protein